MSPLIKANLHQSKYDVIIILFTTVIELWDEIPTLLLRDKNPGLRHLQYQQKEDDTDE
jgi:hypothetical protein